MKKQLPDPLRELRKFAAGLATLLFLIAVIQYLKRSEFSGYFLTGSVLVLLTGLIFPAWLKPVMWLLTKIGHVLNWFMTNLILALLFYTVFTAIALFWRLTGRRPLDVNYRDKRDSYWKSRKDTELHPQQFEKQY
jgi:hypothetical protein